MSHPNLLCLKDTFDESDGVYLVLELAPEGELFNLIIMKQKLTEEETRRVFLQLFQGVRYLVRLQLRLTDAFLTSVSTKEILYIEISNQKIYCLQINNYR